MIKKLLFISSCLILGAAGSKAQRIEEAINNFTARYGPERTYLHYDKSAYSAGETIWFKAYMMNEVVPAVDSKTLYVDWIDDKGTLLEHMVSPLVEGVTNGQFDVPAEYKGRLIHVRAYTKWMLNFDSAFLYNKDIRILAKENVALSKAVPVPSISFFPEGGDLVTGTSNKIAFKANDQWGRPVKVKGIVINSQGKIEDTIRTIHDGMGFFFVTPQPGMTYSAKWKDEKSVEHTTALPEAKSSGVAMYLMLAENARILTVNYPKETAASLDSLHIVGTMYQHPAFTITRATSGSFIRLSIPTKDLPTGILTITVFGKQWEPIAERITYINSDDYHFEPTMEVQHWGLNKRARNEIKITVPDSIFANLSVSVTDEAIGSDSSSNIFSHLLLTSELKGDVYNPAYYFSNSSDSVQQHLDLVMLTHGWRRFKWQDVFAGKFPKPRFERDTSYLTLSGKVYGTLPGQIQPGTAIVLLVQQKDSKAAFNLVPLAGDGTFSDPTTILFDTAHIYYQFPKSAKLSDASVQFMPARLPAPTSLALQSSNSIWTDTIGMARQLALVAEANDVAAKLNMKTLENVTVKSRTKSPVQILDEKYTSGLFVGDGYQFDLVDDPTAVGSLNIFNYLQGKVAGLQVNTTTSPPSLQWRGGAPQLFIDEVPTDADFVSSINMNDVAYVKVFRPPFMGGFNSANGAIAIYTRRGNDVKATPGKGLNNNKVYGYTMIKEFYSPNYGSFKQENEQRDVRTTLYWNPGVIVSPAKKEVVLTFYNNDVAHAFHVVIEGMTKDGRLAHVEQVME